MGSDKTFYLVLTIGAIVLFVVMHSLNKWIGKAKKTVSIGARIIGKEIIPVPGTDENGAPASQDVMRVTFEALGDKQMVFDVSRRVFRELPEEGYGTLAYSGDKFYSFEYKGVTVER
ncbi:DUF2500 family protein [Anaerolentibacter hominis]|uniref:DUF2500 family protein n=1 Tax=Anaerolentibacter hominis TaxID=3079009 RepID=UPI0031B8A6DE